MANLLDLMNEEDRELSIRAFKQRMAGDTSFRKGNKISSQMYLVAELGYYFGWGAIETIKRGYVETFDEETGKRHQQLFTLEEACALVEAARKVWYSKVVDSARGNLVATGSALSKNPNRSFNQGMKTYIKGAKL